MLFDRKHALKTLKYLLDTDILNDLNEDPVLKQYREAECITEDFCNCSDYILVCEDCGYIHRYGLALLSKTYLKGRSAVLETRHTFKLEQISLITRFAHLYNNAHEHASDIVSTCQILYGYLRLEDMNTKQVGDLIEEVFSSN